MKMDGWGRNGGAGARRSEEGEGGGGWKEQVGGGRWKSEAAFRKRGEVV